MDEGIKGLRKQKSITFAMLFPFVTSSGLQILSYCSIRAWNPPSAKVDGQGFSFDEPGSFRDLKRGNVKLFDGRFGAGVGIGNFRITIGINIYSLLSIESILDLPISN
ncbi:hypothetical protein [Fluviicola chungangensis]|uniref:hypothetical protein n=1 Tax=Fluviicola chungangensis TaxID=2597671 RepID=UPI00164362BB|nr:hypothetical protein [Fluviicola chungangensis]